MAMLASRQATAFKIVGYFSTWQGDVNTINHGQVTPINYSFVSPHGKWWFTASKRWWRAFTDAGDTSPCQKGKSIDRR